MASKSTLLLYYYLVLFVISTFTLFATATEEEQAVHCEPYTLSIPSFVDDEINEARNRHNNNNDDNKNGEKVVYPKKKMIIGHRGASFHVPQHTLISYNLALEIGCDYIEPDLVVTRDGYLIASHTVDLNLTTTNVMEMARGWNKPMWFSPYVNRSGYWTFNFTLAEIQQLHVKQAYPQVRTTLMDDIFSMPHLVQIQQLIQDWNLHRLPMIQNVSTASSSSSSSPETTTTTTTTATETTTAEEAATTATTTTTAATTTTTNSYNNNNNDFTIRPTKVGLYAALKDVEWILQDTGMDLVDILITTITQNPDLFQDVLTCHPRKYHHYSIPPLVIQSFNGKELKRFHEYWSQIITTSFQTTKTKPEGEQPVAVTTTTTIPQSPPVPPLVLLVSKKECVAEEFWFTFGEEYHGLIEGIGPDKRCLLQENSGGEDRSITTEEEEFAFMERVKEYDLVVHTWTERPELEYIDTFLGFQNLFDELQYIFCNLNQNVHGIFVSMISTALLAANLPCPQPADTTSTTAEEDNSASLDNNEINTEETIPTNSASGDGENLGEDSSSSASEQQSGSNNAVMCYESEEEKNFYVGLASFVMGVFLTGIISAWLNNNNNTININCRSRRARQRHGRSRLPTEDNLEQEQEQMQQQQEQQPQENGEDGGSSPRGVDSNIERDLEML